jgi:hypothetical protein
VFGLGGDHVHALQHHVSRNRSSQSHALYM